MNKITQGMTGALAADTIINNDLQALIQWKAEVYPIGVVVLRSGLYYLSNAAVIATDVPGTSTKWDRISPWDAEMLLLGGPTGETVYGFDTVTSATSTGTGVYINLDQVNATDGVISEITIRVPAGITSREWVVVSKTGTVYKSESFFTTTNLVTGVNTITGLNVKIPKGAYLALVYNSAPGMGYNTAAGHSYIGFPNYALTVPGTSVNQSTGVISVGYLPYTYKVKTVGVTGQEAVNLLKQLKERGYIPAGNLPVYYLEDFGAKVLDPLNPNAGGDQTFAWEAFINKIATDNTIPGAILKLRGFYKIDAALKEVTASNGSRWAQMQLPRILFDSTTMVAKSLAIVADMTPVWEEQGIIRIPSQFGGCGFYSTLINQPVTNRSNWIFSAGLGKDATLFGEFNNWNLHMDNITFLVNTKDSGGANVKNTMSACDVRYNNNFTFGKLYAHMTTPLTESIAPDANTYGFLLPKRNNHATVYGGYIRSIGFGVGLWATEHLQMDFYLGAANLIGLYCERSYQITISTITLEMSPEPIKMGDLSHLQCMVYQSERVNDVSKWYRNTSGVDFTQDFTQLPNGTPTTTKGTSNVFVASYIVHNEGGAAVAGAWDPNISMRIIHDEFKRGYMPIPNYGSTLAGLPTNPTTGLMGVYQNNKIAIYVNGAWMKADLTVL